MSKYRGCHINECGINEVRLYWTRSCQIGDECWGVILYSYPFSSLLGYITNALEYHPPFYILWFAEGEVDLTNSKLLVWEKSVASHGKTNLVLTYMCPTLRRLVSRLVLFKSNNNKNRLFPPPILIGGYNPQNNRLGLKLKTNVCTYKWRTNIWYQTLWG